MLDFIIWRNTYVEMKRLAQNRKSWRKQNHRPVNRQNTRWWYNNGVLIILYNSDILIIVYKNDIFLITKVPWHQGINICEYDQKLTYTYFFSKII